MKIFVCFCYFYFHSDLVFVCFVLGSVFKNRYFVKDYLY